MNTGRTEEQLIYSYKQDFEDKTGKSIKISLCNKIESKANFIDNIEFWKLVKAVFDYTGWTKAQTFSRSRKEELVLRRALIYYIAVHNGCSLTKCGQLTGRDHSTVIHLIGTFENRLATDMWQKKFFNEVVTYVRENYHLYKRRFIDESTID